MLQYYESVLCSRYLVSATFLTVLYHSSWNYTDVLTMVWRYAYAFYRILKLLFFFFFFFLLFSTFLTFNIDIFHASYYESAYRSRCLVSTTPPTALSKCFWNFTGILLMVWGYTCALGILKLCFLIFFFFFFFLLQYLCDTGPMVLWLTCSFLTAQIKIRQGTKIPYGICLFSRPFDKFGSYLVWW